jgi:uncharacterized membrane protein (Fun14 family)
VVRLLLVPLFILILVYLLYKWITGMEVDQLEYLLEHKLKIFAGCSIVTIFIISFIVINF